MLNLRYRFKHKKMSPIGGLEWYRGIYLEILLYDFLVFVAISQIWHIEIYSNSNSLSEKFQENRINLRYRYKNI